MDSKAKRALERKMNKKAAEIKQLEDKIRSSDSIGEEHAELFKRIMKIKKQMSKAHEKHQNPVASQQEVHHQEKQEAPKTVVPEETPKGEELYEEEKYAPMPEESMKPEHTVSSKDDIAEESTPKGFSKKPAQ